MKLGYCLKYHFRIRTSARSRGRDRTGFADIAPRIARTGTGRHAAIRACAGPGLPARPILLPVACPDAARNPAGNLGCLGVVEPHRTHSFPIAWIPAVLAVGAVFIRYSKSRQRAEPTMSSEAPSLDKITPASVQQWILADERPLENHEPDFFGHRSVAKRTVHQVGHGGRVVALVGAFGTGKSSILNSVCAELSDRSPRIVCAWLDVWTVPEAEDAPRLALSQMIHALDDLVDTIELRGLPDSYKRLAAAEPTGWLARLPRGDSVDSLQALERLSRFLMPSMNRSY